MGTRDRQRRKKQRVARDGSRRPVEGDSQRSAAGGAGSQEARGPSSPRWLEEVVAALVEGAARAGRDEREELVNQLVGYPAGVVAAQLGSRVRLQLVYLLRNGWGPTDIWELSRRRAGTLGTALAAGMLPAAVDLALDGLRSHGWEAECASFGPPRAIDPEASDWFALVGSAIELVEVLDHVGPLGELAGVTVPGAVPRDPERATLLTKIKRLLAMAESTEFTDEADSFTAKATELMLRHRIDRASVEANSGIVEVGGVVSRRLWIEPPYVEHKSMLCHVVAEANNCRAVRHAYGFTAVVGLADDLELVELLFASLLVQATRQMTSVGRSSAQTEQAACSEAERLFAAWERSIGPPASAADAAAREEMRSLLPAIVARERRSPAFRRSFLVAYATRIRDRLADLSAHTTAAAEAELGVSFLPVLARREQEVEDAVEHLFGVLQTTRVRTYNQAGWVAGAAAADLADLNVRDELRTG